jgi:type I restriction enzyme M protein
MATTTNQLVQKLMNYRNVLRDDGVSTIEYVEQLTYLLFLKMADERQKSGLGEVVPIGLDWQSLLDRDGDDLEVHYRHILESLGRQAGTLGTIFRKAQNRIQDPAKLRRLVVSLINEETWTSVDTDVRRLRSDPPGRCRRHEVGCRAVLHAPPAGAGHVGVPAAEAGRDGC